MRISKKTSEPLDASIGLFKAFSDPVRLRLLNLIAGGEVCVCHLHEALDLPQSTVSRHLAYLRKRGLVAGRKEGLWVHYRLAKPVGELHRHSIGCLGTCSRRIETLRVTGNGSNVAHATQSDADFFALLHPLMRMIDWEEKRVESTQIKAAVKERYGGVDRQKLTGRVRRSM